MRKFLSRRSILPPERVRQSLIFFVALSGLGYLYLCGRGFYSYRCAQRGTVEGLSIATRVSPDNAEYWRQLGLVRLYEQKDPDGAAADLQRSIQLNSRNADSWIGIAFAYQLLGETAQEREAISHALQVEPKRPEIAWQAANLYAVLGDSRLLLNEVCILSQYDPTNADAALNLAHRAMGLSSIDCPEREKTN